MFVPLLPLAALALAVPQQPVPTVEMGLWSRSPAPTATPDSLTTYMYDDGAPDQALGYTNGGDIIWLQYFDPIGGADTLTEISTMNGRVGSVNGVVVGTVGNVAVWDDPTNDGVPNDAVPLTIHPWTVQFKNMDMFEPVAITPTVVSSRFFIGAWVPHLAGNFPAPLDNNTLSMGRAWINGAPTGQLDPSNLSAGFGLTEMDTLFPGVWCLRAEGTGNAPTTFCTAKTGLACTQGGAPAIKGTGVPSASATSGFLITAGPARTCKSGILMYNTSSAATGLPFQGGTLCVTPGGVRRAGPANSKGTPGGANCDGEFSLDMNSFAAGVWLVPDCAGNPSGLAANNPAPFLLTVGQDVFCQYWGRDSVATGSFVSDGLQYTIQP